MARLRQSGRIMTVYLGHEDVVDDLVGRAQIALGAESGSATVRSALRLAIHVKARHGPSAAERLTRLEDTIREQGDLLREIRKALGSLGGRERSSAIRK